MNRKKFGERIRYFRNKNNMTQQELADKTGVTREFISLLESGATNTSLEILVDIANTLSVSTDDLLSDSLESPSSPSLSKMQEILLDCNKKEEAVILRTAGELKKILYSLGV